VTTNEKLRSPFPDGFERDVKSILLCYDVNYRVISWAEARKNLRRLGIELDADPGPSTDRPLSLEIVRPAADDEPTMEFSDEDMEDIFAESEYTPEELASFAEDIPEAAE